MSEFDPQFLVAHIQRLRRFLHFHQNQRPFENSSMRVRNNPPNSSQDENLSSAEIEANSNQIRKWPNRFCFMFACLNCTLSLLNISRFSILTINYGVIFLLQFFALSMVFGVPLLLFFSSVGQYLGSGIIDLWRITPIFQGIGIGLLLSQGLFSIYNSTLISWMMIFLKDSIFLVGDHYKWSLCYQNFHYSRNCTSNSSAQWQLDETIPDYFNGVVLQRSSPGYPQSLTSLRFQSILTLGVVWIPVFLVLSKGLRSYGRVVILLGAFPIFSFTLLSAKFLCLLPFEDFWAWIANTNWNGLIFDGQSWTCVARECFFTWGMLGASILQLSSHNSFKQKLSRNVALVIILTLWILVLSGFMGVAIMLVLRRSGLEYVPSSFESLNGYKFLKLKGKDLNLLQDVLRNSLASKSIRVESHVSFLAGIRIVEENTDPDMFSGYQVMRLATELIPSIVSLLGPKIFSPCWTVLFYLSSILMSLGQQLALVHTVISGILAIRPKYLRQFETFITFLTCLLGYVLTFPMATELNLFIVYFLDYTIGCGWWEMILYSFMFFAILIISGKSYSAGNFARLLIGPCENISNYQANNFDSFIIMVISFSWKVILPSCLFVLSVVSMKICHMYEMFDWTYNSGYKYFPFWVREIGALMQLFPLLMAFIVGIIQTCKYCMRGTENLRQKWALLTRPEFEMRDLEQVSQSHRVGVSNLVTFINCHPRQQARNGNIQMNDFPPKYSPPPSYSTASGARMARFLRQSIRQFRSESWARSLSRTDLIQENLPMRSVNSSPTKPDYPPPDYATAMREISSNSFSNFESGNVIQR